MEKIINAEDTERVFSLNRAGWEAYVKQMVFPEGWKARLQAHGSGTGIAAFDTTTGRGLGVQAIYTDDVGSPVMLVVSSYYAPESFPKFGEESVRAKLEAGAREELGSGYSVGVAMQKLGPFDAVEITVSRIRPRRE